jgi:hypothetical protein
MSKPLAILTAFPLLAALAGLSACAGTAAPEPSERSTSTARTAEPAPDLAGTWAFDLERSDVAHRLRAKCASEAAGDAAKEAACWDELRGEARLEKIRFSKARGNRSTWMSFVADGSKEIVLLEVPLELTADGPMHVVAKIAGTPTGPQAERFAKSPPQTMRIEIVDDRRIALFDPEKGRLVYVKE